ncbi:MAG: hypothetical protein HY749_17520 [Gammaproteobacteria bacterium]|nr:hypothetical protein [Gammaproteobacteria bacterium]MBI5616619.1 hypothetical protein [Gammaproteobacteria bacterium]
MKKRFILGLGCLTTFLTLSSVQAADHCAWPMLRATNLRPACEQYGSSGLSGLYENNRHIAELVASPVTHKIAAVTPHATTGS